MSYKLLARFLQLINMKKKENKKIAAYEGRFKKYKKDLRNKGTAKKHKP